MAALSSPHLPGLAVSILLGGMLFAAPAVHAAAPDVSVAKPWIRFLTPEMPAAGYFTLHNNGAQPVELTGAASPACGALMLHESMVMNGTAHMRMVSGITVPAHGAVAFQPGGYHLMCMHPLAGMAPGHSATVSLRFKDGGSVSAQFPVYGPKGP